MSFLEQLCKNKNLLKSTQTIITQSDGRRYLETKAGTSEIPTDRSFGFVVDTKPDNVPAKITENIYLGSQDCCELQVLQLHNIKNVLSVGIEAPCTYNGIVYKFVKCLDLPDTDLTEVLDTSLAFLYNAIESDENVLVHCNAGVSRSSTVVLGFLILVYDLSYNKAFEIVKSKRCCIRPNDGFVNQLKALDKTKFHNFSPVVHKNDS